MKNIVILGSTGSIGVSALDVIDALGREEYNVLALSAHSNAALFLKQIEKYKPRFAAAMSEAAYEEIKGVVPPYTKLLPPDADSLIFMASLPSADLVLNALVGAVGFAPLVASIKHGKNIALANKEPIVMAGATLMEECDRWQSVIIPVDSEPSAIFQSIENKSTKGCGNFNETVNKVFLTASGGPFFKYKGSLDKVTPQKALAHPRWSMGKKITVDSATLMNKGFETIEIMHMFKLPLEKIEIVIHPQSLIHGAVEYKDGSILAQMSVPDMRIPIQYALTYPERKPCPAQKLTLKEMSRFEFAEPDFKKFPCLELALWCAHKGGSFPAVLGAADEVAVAAFLREEILFTDIPKLVYGVIKAHGGSQQKITLAEASEADAWAREKAADFLSSKKYQSVIL